MSAIDGLFTVQDVVIAALRKSGVLGLGQFIIPGDSDILDAQNDLSDMLGQWNVKTWITFDKLDLGFQSDGRSGPYTVGPGGNYNITQRTDRIEAGYVRILSTNGGLPVDQPLREIPSRESYATDIALKTLIAFPKAYFYDTSYPTGNVYFYPEPQASIYEMHIIIKNAFPLILPLNLSLLTLPPETRAAMKFCLARRLRQAYGKGLRPDPELNALCRDAEATMRNSHVQVAELKMPPTVLGPRGGPAYNIYGDTYS